MGIFQHRCNLIVGHLILDSIVCGFFYKLVQLNRVHFNGCNSIWEHFIWNRQPDYNTAELFFHAFLSHFTVIIIHLFFTFIIMTETIYVSGLKYINCELMRVSV